MWRYVGNLGKRWNQMSQVVAPRLQSSILLQFVRVRALPLTAGNVNAEVLPYSEMQFSVTLLAAHLP